MLRSAPWVSGVAEFPTFDHLVITLTETRNVRRPVYVGTTFEAFIQQLSELIQTD